MRRITLGGVSITTAATHTAHVPIMHALLQRNNCIYHVYIAALFDEISSRNNKSERNYNSFISSPEPKAHR